MKEVRIYTKPACRNCERAKAILEERGFAYREINAENDGGLRCWLAYATGDFSLPQIFIGGEPVGGFRELKLLDENGELTRRVRE